MFKRKYACNGKSTRTPLGTYTKDPRPDGAIQCGESIVGVRHHTGKMFPEKVRILFEPVFNAQENNTLLFQIFLDVVIDHFRIVLRADACQILLFRFGQTEAVKVFLIFSGTSSQDFWSICFGRA